MGSSGTLLDGSIGTVDGSGGPLDGSGGQLDGSVGPQAGSGAPGWFKGLNESSISSSNAQFEALHVYLWLAEDHSTEFCYI